MTIRADQVRFSQRDVRRAVVGAALLGAFLGAMYLIIPTIVASLTGSNQTTPALLGLFLLFAIPIGAILGLGAAIGAGIAYAVARRARARRVSTFTLLMAIGAGLRAAFGAFIGLALGDGSGYQLTHPANWLPSVIGVFVGSSLPMALIVPLAFRGRARYPVVDPTEAPTHNAAPAG